MALRLHGRHGAMSFLSVMNLVTPDSSVSYFELSVRVEVCVVCVLGHDFPDGLTAASPSTTQSFGVRSASTLAPWVTIDDARAPSPGTSWP